ncbi:MAG: hypothetical protein HY791_09545 [Deltaproteobacteria bacterium]|nr:hypothetical protein [Deltaproteobacteria bacterium]
MLVAGPSLLLIATTLALHLEDAHGVAQPDAAAIAEAIGAAVQRRAGVSPVLVLESPGADCRSIDRCYGEIRAKTNAEEIIFVRLLGSLTRVRVLAERVIDGTALRRADNDVERDRGSWGATFDGIALILYPEGKLAPKVAETKVPSDGATKATEPGNAIVDPKPDGSVTPPIPEVGAQTVTTDPALTAEAPPSDGPNILPWVVIGGSAAALIGGTVFGLRNRALVRDGKAETDPNKRARIEDSVFTTGLAANVLIGVAILGGVTGTVLLLTDD